MKRAFLIFLLLLTVFPAFALRSGQDAVELENIKIDHDFILSSDDILKLEQLPKAPLMLVTLEGILIFWLNA